MTDTTANISGEARHGVALLHDPRLNRMTGFTQAERERLASWR
jgi:hypothetical protein